jgi:hypothetical protein
MLTPLHTHFKMIASVLREKGYTVWHGAQYVPPTTEANQPPAPVPDIIALHAHEPALRVFVRANEPSGIWHETRAGGTLVHCTGVEDLRALLSTGRPAVKNAGILFE